MNRDKLLQTMQAKLTEWFNREFIDARPPNGEMGESAEIHFEAFLGGYDDADEPLCSLIVKTSRSTNDT